jgi:hypothetical protein
MNQGLRSALQSTLSAPVSSRRLATNRAGVVLHPYMFVDATFACAIPSAVTSLAVPHPLQGDGILGVTSYRYRSQPARYSHPE